MENRDDGVNWPPINRRIHLGMPTALASRGRCLLSQGILALILLCLLSSASLLHAATRVALVSTCGGNSAGDVLALAEASLSADTNVVLVERTLVQQVLDEQKLTRCGLSDSAQALAVGKLLGVQVFATLETFPGSQEALGLVAFDASSGVKLWDSVLPAGGTENTVESIATSVRGACQKRQQAIKNSWTMCLLAVRNADLPREMDSVCQSVGRLLERRLLGSPSLAVLERQRLEEVNRERSLPTGTALGDLFPSLVLVELEVARSDDGKGIKATAFLSDAAGNSLGKVRAASDPSSPAALAQELLASLLQNLGAISITPTVDPTREAARFRQEATFLTNYGEIEHGLQAAEAACALAPSDQACQRTLVSCLVVVAHNLLQPGLGADLGRSSGSLQVSTENLDLSLKLVQRALAIHPLDIRISDLMAYLSRVSRVVEGHDDETRKLLLELQQRLCKQIFEQAGQAASRDVHDAISFDWFTEKVSNLYLFGLDYGAPTASEWTTQSIALISLWLKLAEKYTWHWDHQASINHLLAWPSASISPWDGRMALHDSSRWLSARDFARWREFFESIQRHPVPLVRAYGMIGQLSLDVRQSQVSTNEATRRSESIVQFVKGELAGSSLSAGDETRLLYYRAAQDAIDVLPSQWLNPEARWNAYTDLLNFMLEKREIAGSVVEAPTRAWVSHHWLHGDGAGIDRLRPEYAPSVLHNIDRVMAMIDESDSHLLGVKPMELRDRLGRARQDVTSWYPNIAQGRSVPWTTTRLLFDVAEYGLERIDDVVIDGDSAYLIGLGQERAERFIQLVRVSIPSGQIEMLGRANHDWEMVNNLGGAITGTSVSDGSVYVGTRRYGLFIFPVAGGAPTHITTTDGLPSNWVRSVAALDGKLYAGLGENEGFLIAYDIGKHTCDVLASSRRKEKRSPLDDVPSPFVIAALRSDAAHKRLLVQVNSSSGIWSEDRELSGLWQFAPKTSAWKRLLPLRNPVYWVSPIRDNQLLLYWWHFPTIVSFDIQNEQASLLYTEAANLSYLPTLRHSENTPTLSSHHSTPFLIVDGWLWSGLSFGRVSHDGQITEFFPSLPGDKFPNVAGNLVSLERVGNGHQVLVTKKYKIWLLTLRGDSAKE